MKTSDVMYQSVKMRHLKNLVSHSIHISLTVLTTVQVMEDMVERAEPQEHADGEDFRRCDDSQQGENVLIVEHPAQYRGKRGTKGGKGGRVGGRQGERQGERKGGRDDCYPSSSSSSC